MGVHSTKHNWTDSANLLVFLRHYVCPESLGVRQQVDNVVRDNIGLYCIGLRI